MLLSKEQKIAEDSIIVIGHLLNRNSEKLKDVHDYENIEDEFEEFINEDKRSDTIYRNSPFFKRYNSIMVTIQDEIEKHSNDEDESCLERNKYYALFLVEHVVTKWMPYTILWSAMDLDLIDPNISRVSNAFIESTMRVNKELVFNRITNSSIADRVRELENARKSTMAKITLNAQLKETKKKVRNQNIRKQHQIHLWKKVGKEREDTRRI